jgi:hypothetical protein
VLPLPVKRLPVLPGYRIEPALLFLYLTHSVGQLFLPVLFDLLALFEECLKTKSKSLHRRPPV